MKSKRGVSLIAVAITIVIVLALSGAAYYEFNKLKIKTSKTKFASDLYTVNKLVKDYEFINSEYPIIKNKEFKLDINSIPEKEKNQFLLKAASTNQEAIYEETLYYIDYNILDIQNLTNGKQQDGIDDVYAISKLSKKIYYLKGQTIDGITYYTLTDELYKLLNISEVK